MEECKEGKVALLLGKGVEGVIDIVIVLDREVGAEKEGFVLCRANGWNLVPSPPPPSMNSWTQHIHYYYHIFLTD